MQNVRKINENLYYTGCSDRRLKLFESAYSVPYGVSYNSYLLKDEKNILFDTVDKNCSLQFFENIEAVLNGEKLDYLVIHHIEPDHAALIPNIVKMFPDIKIICNSKTHGMLKQFFNFDTEKYVQEVKEGDILNTGKHELTFYMAPMVHWPEVMVTYDSYDKILYSADAFGSFGAINGNLYDGEISSEKYFDEVRRYYTNIVGKYGMQVQMLLKKALNLDIKMICPLHGVILKDKINEVINKYDLWSRYVAENKGVLIAYSSVYGGTENVAELIASKLSESGVKDIAMYDVSYTEHSYVLAEAFKYQTIVLATTTYNADVFESMKNFINSIVGHNLQNRKYVIIENGSWVPTCGNIIKNELEKLKGTEFLSENLQIKSRLKEHQDINNIIDVIKKSL